MVSRAFMYRTTIGLCPFGAMPIGFYAALADAISFFLTTYATFSASCDLSKIDYVIHDFLLLIIVYKRMILFPSGSSSKSSCPPHAVVLGGNTGIPFAIKDSYVFFRLSTLKTSVIYPAVDFPHLFSSQTQT